MKQGKLTTKYVVETVFTDNELASNFEKELKRRYPDKPTELIIREDEDFS